MRWVVVIAALLGALGPTPGSAFIGHLGQSIVDGLTSAFWAVVNAIADACRNFVFWLANTLKSGVLSLAWDMSQAWSAAAQALKARAASHLEGLLAGPGDPAGRDTFLLQLVHAGPLPRAYYLRPWDLKAEVAHLEELVSLSLAMAASAAVILTLAILVFLGLFGVLRTLKRQWHELQDLEEHMNERVQTEIQAYRKVKDAEI